MSLILYGQQACGKTRHGAAIAAHFGLTQVIDDWAPGDPLPTNALAITNVPGVPGAMEYHVAKAALTGRSA